LDGQRKKKNKECGFLTKRNSTTRGVRTAEVVDTGARRGKKTRKRRPKHREKKHSLGYGGGGVGFGFFGL